MVADPAAFAYENVSRLDSGGEDRLFSEKGVAPCL